MPTTASTNLNRILRLTAGLLFEKGEDPKNVAKLLNGFVTASMVRKWYEQHCRTSGIPFSTNLRTHKRRMPMPPINWNSVEIKTLDEMRGEKADEADEINW